VPIDPYLPAEFFELVGRIVVSAAIFEDELATLATRIDDPGTLDAGAEGESDLPRQCWTTRRALFHTLANSGRP